MSSQFSWITRFLNEFLTDGENEFLTDGEMEAFNQIIDRYPTKEEFTELVGSYFELSLLQNPKRAGIKR